MQYDECKPTIEKLYRMLYKRKPFPECVMDDSEGIQVRQGAEPWQPCKEGYEPAIIEQEIINRFMKVRVCRKFLGYKEVIDWEDRGGKRKKKVPVYDDYEQKRRPEPYYVEVLIDGKPQGQRFYYKKKKK
jgi:hypothetical protein